LSDGHKVIGIDSLTNYYSRSLKEENIRGACSSPLFTFYPADILSVDLEPLVQDVELVFHLAAQAGVRLSWGKCFETYTRLNVLGTQHLLEACRAASHLRRFVYASSSSVYGTPPHLPVSENAPTSPVSPYGVTKLAAEHLCSLYHTNLDVPTVSLRYFSVYGSRQRPDMAFNRFIRAALTGESVTVFEDGMQTRDFTHVGDVVEASMLAAASPISVGRVYNIAGGSHTTVRDSLTLIQKITGRNLRVEHGPRQSGDVRDTYADTSRAREELEYAPKVDLEAGLRDEIQWLAQLPSGV
jgi:UDP-glucose 4-epimerase